MDRTGGNTEGVQALWLETRRSRMAGLGVYVFRAGPWLIDAGYHRARQQLQGWPGLVGAAGCLLTHGDEDHVGNGAALSRDGLPVLAPARVVDALDRVERLPLYRYWIWGTARPGPVAPLSGVAAADGWTLVPLATPGHSADHHVYHEPERDLVFAADLYIGRRVQVARSDEKVALLIESLKKVRELKPRAMFCAHRGQVARPVEALETKIAWMEELVGRALELTRQGMEAKRIRRQLLGREGPIRYVSAGEYCKQNLIDSALQVGG